MVWLQRDGGDEHVWYYEIASGQARKLSTTTDPKKMNSLHVDLKQAVWVECAALPCANANASLWFHPGSGMAADTAEVPLGALLLDVNYSPYIADGLVTWVANDGDTEVEVME